MPAALVFFVCHAMLAAGSSVMSMEWLASAARHLALRDQAAQEEQRTGELREEPQELQAPVDSPAKTAAKDTQLDAAVPPPPAPEYPREFHKCFINELGKHSGVCKRNYALSPVLCVRTPSECKWCHHSSHFKNREAPHTRRGGWASGR